MYMDCTGAAECMDARERPSFVYEILNYPIYLFRINNESYYLHIRSTLFTNKRQASTIYRLFVIHDSVGICPSLNITGSACIWTSPILTIPGSIGIQPFHGYPCPADLFHIFCLSTLGNIKFSTINNSAKQLLKALDLIRKLIDQNIKKMADSTNNICLIDSRPHKISIPFDP